MKLNIIIHGNTTEFNTAMTKTTSNISINIPTLTRPTPTHYELHSQCIAQSRPYNRQSSHMTFTVTETLYIWVIKKSELHVETTSPYEGHTSCPSLSQLLHHTSRFLHHISRLPKILHWLCLTHLMMLVLWGAPYE